MKRSKTGSELEGLKPTKKLTPAAETMIRNNMHKDRHCRQTAIDYGFITGEAVKAASDKYRDNYDEIFRK